MKYFIILANSSILLLFCGCGRQAPEQDTFLIRGIELRKSGKTDLAEKFLRRHLFKYPESKAGLLEMASLCDESRHKPVAAIYFYDTALEVMPANDPDRKDIEFFRNQQLEKLIASAPRPETGELERLRQENRSLRGLLKKMTPSAPAKLTETIATVSAVENQLTYTVQSGDSPGKIALKFYGSAAEYPRILQANDLTEKSVLHIGQQLQIPAKRP